MRWTWGMLDEDGPFLGSLTTWLALGLLVTIGVARTAPVRATIDDLPHTWTRVAVASAPIRAVPAPAPPAIGVERRTSAPAAGAPTADRAPARGPARGGDPVGRAQRLLGTHGDGNGRTRWLDEARRGGGPDLADADYARTDGEPDPGGRRGGAGPEGPARADGIGPLGGGRVDGVVGGVVEVRPTVIAAGPDAATEERALSGAVQRLKGQLQQCYERELKAHPTLEGRVALSFAVEGGRVRGRAVVDEDTTGHDPLARCVAGRVERFDFGAASGEVTVPVVFVHP